MKLGLSTLDMIFASKTQYKLKHKNKIINSFMTVELYWRSICYIISIRGPVGRHIKHTKLPERVSHFLLITSLSLPQEPHCAKNIYSMSDCSNQVQFFYQTYISNTFTVSQQLILNLLEAGRNSAIPWQRCKFTHDAFCSQGYALNNESAAHSFPESSWTLCFEIYNIFWFM